METSYQEDPNTFRTQESDLNGHLRLFFIYYLNLKYFFFSSDVMDERYLEFGINESSVFI